MTSKTKLEVRGHFLVGTVPDEVDKDGKVLSVVGWKKHPLCYTNQWVIGVKTFEEEIVAELADAIGKPLKKGPLGSGYKEQPGAMLMGASGMPRWREEVIKTINTRSKQPKRCVTDLIKYTLEACEAKYKGTIMEKRYMIYADALSAWWEKEAQEFILKHWPHLINRFIDAVGTSRVGTLARKKGPPGNSPENGRGTDSFGFADLEWSMNFNHALATAYPFGDPRRIFGQGSQPQLWYLMTECWDHCAPTPDRIKEDIFDWPNVMDAIVAAFGTVVADLNFRHGRREMRIDGKEGADGTKSRKTKCRKRDRKGTMPTKLAAHPLLLGAESRLLGLPEPPTPLPPPPTPPPAAAVPPAPPLGGKGKGGGSGGGRGRGGGGAGGRGGVVGGGGGRGAAGRGGGGGKKRPKGQSPASQQAAFIAQYSSSESESDDDGYGDLRRRRRASAVRRGAL
jgi:hypothetical protein